MWLRLIATVILIYCGGNDCALSNFNESTSNEIHVTSTNVDRVGYSDPRYLLNAEEHSSYLRHDYIDEILDNTANSFEEMHLTPYPDHHNQGEIHQDHQSTYTDHQYDQQDHKTHINLSLEPDQGHQEDPACSRFFRFSILGIVLIMLVIFNGIISGATLYKSVMNYSADSTINTITNVNTNNNADTNNNDNTNDNVNINDNFVIGRHARQKQTNSKFAFAFAFNDLENDNLSKEEETKGINGEGIGRRATCACQRSRGIDSWLSTARKSLERVWSGARDFLSVNPECASRMACEVASPFVPSSVTPLLAAFPSKMEETRSLLMSAAVGDCAVTYNRCTISLDPGIAPFMQGL